MKTFEFDPTPARRGAALHLAWPWLPLAALALAAPLLSGCQANRAESAWQLMQQQQQEQALMRQEEDDADRRRAESRPQVALSLIRKSQDEGRYFASLAYLDAYRQAYGDSPEVAVLRADALRKTGQGAASEDAYRQLTAGPEAARAWHGLGLLAGARGDFDQAAAYLGRAARLRPTDPQVLGDLGYALLRAGSPQGARVPLGQAAELDPGNPRILGNLAVLLLAEGESDAAQQVMTRAGLSPEAREQVRQLAATIHAQAAAPAGPAAARPVDEPVRAAGSPSTASAFAGGAPYSSPAYAGGPVAADRLVMPVLQGQGPVMDRFGNPPVVQ